jgi:hypothetical protein
MNRRATLTLTTIALLGLAVATALPRAGFAQSNSLIGTWKINLAKSKDSPGPPPRSQTLTYQAEGQGLRVTVDTIDAQGNPAKGAFVLFFDGKSYPVTGIPDWDASTYKQVNDTTTESTRMKAGKVVQTATRVVSADGKTLTITATGVNATGQQINNVDVYDKQ